MKRMAAILFDMHDDVQGNNAFAPKFTDINKATTLEADTEQHFTIPSDFAQWIVIFSYSSGANVFVACNEEAVTAGSSFEDTASQLMPATRCVKAGDVLSFITGDTMAIVGVSLYGVS